ncbi:hypothetical protein PSTT_16741, partial [Puccinia striiformis]
LTAELTLVILDIANDSHLHRHHAAMKSIDMSSSTPVFYKSGCESGRLTPTPFSPGEQAHYIGELGLRQVIHVNKVGELKRRLNLRLGSVNQVGSAVSQAEPSSLNKHGRVSCMSFFTLIRRDNTIQQSNFVQGKTVNSTVFPHNQSVENHVKVTRRHLRAAVNPSHDAALRSTGPGASGPLGSGTGHVPSFVYSLSRDPLEDPLALAGKLLWRPFGSSADVKHALHSATPMPGEIQFLAANGTKTRPQVAPKLTQPPVPVASDSTTSSDIVPISDLELSLWEGTTIDCECLAHVTTITQKLYIEMPGKGTPVYLPIYVPPPSPKLYCWSHTTKPEMP